MKKYEKIKKSINKKCRYLLNNLRNGHKILVLSDSHGGVFEYIHDNHMLSNNFINVDIVGGATSYGLNNIHSKTNAFNRFKLALRRFTKYNIILIQLGEIDTAFILWKKIQDNNLTMRESIRLSIIGYEKLIEYIVSLNKEIIITGVVLPTLKDGQIADKNVRLRNTINASQKDRTEMVIMFNEELKKISEKYKLHYIDITSDTLDLKTGTIKHKFTRENKSDHHQNFITTSRLWVKQIIKVLK
jgi:hypothetical protein